MRRRETEGGFTLIELMVVVVIIAILAAVVVPSFIRESRKTQTRSEVTPMFAEFAMKLEEWKSDNGVFMSTPACPVAVPSANYASTTCSATTEWTDLRIIPSSSSLRCQYTVTAGLPTDLATPPAGFTFVAPTTQVWYFIHAICDGDGQGGTNAEYMATSMDATIVSINEAK